MRAFAFVLALAILTLAAPAAAEVTYEVFVRAFADGDGDGIGDLAGLTGKLPYIKDLGADAVWLMPIFPSPSYHGYDVTDYYGINPDYGSMEDFEALIEAARGLGLRVYLDLPINHTSIEHPWFDANPDYYVWADENANLELRVWGEKVWKPRRGGHYYAIFWDGMPDLNYDNPLVREEMKAVAKFWLEAGADGFRLDAASHIYGMGERGNRQDIERSARWWEEFKAACEAVDPDCYLLGEAWESLDKRAELLPGLHAAVNFDVGEEIAAFIKGGGGGKLYVRNRMKAYAAYDGVRGGIPDAPFLTNHDQPRVFSTLSAKPERAKLAASMLLTLPGNPILYYGEEIGMMGAKPDEELRTPMLWGNGDPMQTDWHPSRYNARTIPLSEQAGDPDSLYNHYRRLLAFRREHPVLTEGAMGAAEVGNDTVVAYTLTDGDAEALILHNHTSITQATDLCELPPYTSAVFIGGEGWSFP